jgi:hypothetical protein
MIVAPLGLSVVSAYSPKIDPAYKLTIFKHNMREKPSLLADIC